MRSKVTKRFGGLVTSQSGDIIESNKSINDPVNIIPNQGKTLPDYAPINFMVRNIPPIPTGGYETNVLFCIPNYERYRFQLYPTASFEDKVTKQFDYKKTLQQDYKLGKKVRVLWIVPIGTSLYAIVWRHTMDISQGGQFFSASSSAYDNNPIPHTQNSIFSTLSTSTPEQIDEDLSLPLQFQYLCEIEPTPYISHTFNKNIEIPINFGTAQMPDYQPIYYSFSVQHTVYELDERYISFERHVTWELKWDDIAKFNGFSNISRNPTGAQPNTISINWLRCKFSNITDEPIPWAWHFATSPIHEFEYDFDLMYEPFFVCSQLHPESFVTDDGHCDVFSKDLTGGYPEYICGAILTPDMIYMETQQYSLQYTQDNSPDFTIELYQEDCDGDGTPEDYGKVDYTSNEEYSQTISEHIICKDSFGTIFDELRYVDSNNVSDSLWCRGYNGTDGELDEYGFCDFHTTNKTFSSQPVHKFHQLIAPRPVRLKPHSFCDTAIFDYYEYESTGVQLLLVGWWQTITKGKQYFNSRIKATHHNNEEVRLYFKDGDTWKRATNSDIPQIEPVLEQIRLFLKNNTLHIVPGWNPSWDAQASLKNLAWHNSNCMFGVDESLKLSVDASDCVSNVTYSTSLNGGNLTVNIVYQNAPNILPIQYCIRGIEGWDLEHKWFENCSLSYYVDDGGQISVNIYPVEQSINEVGSFTSWRTGKFPLFSLGMIMTDEPNLKS